MNRSYVYDTRFSSTNHPPSLDISSRIVFFRTDEVAKCFVFSRCSSSTGIGRDYCSPPIRLVVTFSSVSLALRLEKLWQAAEKIASSRIKSMPIKKYCDCLIESHMRRWKTSTALGTKFAVLDWRLVGKSAVAFGEVSVCSFIKRALRFAVLATAIAISLGSAGCTGPAATSMEFAAASTAPRTYVLRPNDQIRVQVYNEPTISGDYKIDGSGAVSIPLAGRLRAAGLTTAQLERSIVRHVDGSILKDPHVNVQVSTYGPFFVRGEVKQPGQFPYAPGLTIGDAVALAGGYTYRANETAAFVRPSGGTQEVLRPLTADIPVSPGDNIRIPERYF